MQDIIDATWFKEKNINNISLFFPLISFPLWLWVCWCWKIHIARFSLYVPLYLLLETDPGNSNFWALHMCMLDAIPHIIFRVFYILHVRSVLQPSGLFLGMWRHFWYWSFSYLPELHGKKSGWAEDRDRTGGLSCPVCMVRSWSAWELPCFLSVRCTLFPEKQGLR